MGLTATIANASKAAMGAVGDVRTVTTYRKVEHDYYDAETGGTKDRFEDYDIVNKSVVTNFVGKEVDGEHILREDKKVLFLQADLSITPKAKDFIIIDLVKWWVVDYKADPANALWILQVRKS